MANNSLYRKVVALSPHVEMLVRKVYWSNVGLFSSKKTKKKKKKKELPPASFDKIVAHLKAEGIGTSDLLVLHSAFSPLKRTKKSPQMIIDDLRELIGAEGTLAMPGIRKYPEAPPPEEYLSANLEKTTFVYDVKNTPIWTGALPRTLIQQPNAVSSRFPLNSMIAVGPLAQPMMEKNLEGEKPTPNGVNSSWKFCTDHNAWVVSIGTDLTHSLTMIHTAEDVLAEKWPVQPWYRDRKFKIIDGDFETTKIVRERRPVWGAMHFGERTLCKDLIEHKVMSSTSIDGITVEILRSKDLLDFLNARNKTGYPYFWVKSHLKH